MRAAALLRAGGLAATLLASPASEAAERLQVTWRPPQPRLGDVAWVHVTGIAPGRSLDGRLGDRPLRFFAHGEGHAALVGIDLLSKAGRHEWYLTVTGPRHPPRPARGNLQVKPREFAVQRLTLPPAMVDLDPETERRALQEGERLRTLYASVTLERLWRGRFLHPIGNDDPGTGFGSRRIINGQPRAPHSGVDYAAPAGTPVLASNSGRVALVAEYFFPGRLVILDHGLGVYTLYFHLDTATVSEGEAVHRGQPVGTVGATGRATGPHLHFGAQIGRARVDPVALLTLDPAD